MRILFATQPGAGHFNPLVPFARAMSTAGHDVTVACAASFVRDVEAAGLRALPSGIDWRIDRLSDFFPDAPPAGPDRAPWIVRHWTHTTARAMTHDLLRLIDSWRVDLIVHEPAEFGACLAAELRGIPHATAGAFWPRPLGPLATPYNALRQELSLAPDPHMREPYRYLVLAPMLPEWIGADEQAPPTIHFVRPAAPDGNRGARPESTLEQTLPQRPLVHATLGTTEANRIPGLYEAIIAGLSSEPIDLLVAVGQSRDPAEFGAQPPNVRIERHVLHAELLPQCDVVVNHGGYGTVMACLTAGVPMVVIPVQGDQPRNAQRCGELGVGLVVGPDERSPESIRTAVRAVLADPAYKRNAVRVQKATQELPGIDHAVELLERLARDRQPLLSQQVAP
jgi:UDP:flavonoid glycosyltransferase YjiC (YdhE family)